VSDLVVIADSHMVRQDEELARFTALLDSLAGNTATLYLLGDIFNIWLGNRRYEMDHMPPVLDALRRLAAGGTRVRYVEGNRDFHIAHGYLGDPFAAVIPDGEEALFGGRRLWLSHGDLVNEADRPYRIWRRFSKSRPVWSLFSALPGAAGRGIGDALEKRLRGTNVRHKSYFPMEACEAYGRRLVAAGFDRVLLGHIHIEKVLDIEGGGRTGRLIVLPDWRSSHRYLRYSPNGAERFVDFA
jgi:UDP-2,3-diacylglucosamine hydrolase